MKQPKYIIESFHEYNLVYAAEVIWLKVFTIDMSLAFDLREGTRNDEKKMDANISENIRFKHTL